MTIEEAIKEIREHTGDQTAYVSVTAGAVDFPQPTGNGHTRYVQVYHERKGLSGQMESLQAAVVNFKALFPNGNQPGTEAAEVVAACEETAPVAGNDTAANDDLISATL